MSLGAYVGFSRNGNTDARLGMQQFLPPRCPLPLEPKSRLLPPSMEPKSESQGIGSLAKLAEKLIEKLFDAEKPPTKIVALVWLVSVVVLFSPERLHQRLHTKLLTDQYGFWFGLGLISSTAFLFLTVGHWFIRKRQWHARRDHHRHQIFADLENLSRREAIVLREFFLQGRSSVLMPVSDPTVAGLIHKGILICVGQTGKASLSGPLFPFSISKIAAEVFTVRHAELPERAPDSYGIQQIRSERPAFALEVERDESRLQGIYQW